MRVSTGEGNGKKNRNGNRNENRKGNQQKTRWENEAQDGKEYMSNYQYAPFVGNVNFVVSQR